MSKDHLINANIHRAKEGARVLEDIARFYLHDTSLFQQIRAIRHGIQRREPISTVKDDLGGVNFVENNVRINLLDIIQANAIRLQEALRVLEEMSQEMSEKHDMKKLRYQAYTTHSRLYYLAEQWLQRDKLEGLYLIIDTDIISSPLEEIIEIINQSAVNIVQYRSKATAKLDVFNSAYKIRQKLDPNKLFIINDHIDIALDLGSGVHLGQNDYPLERVRNIIPENFILGVSCHNLQEAKTAMQWGASYITAGCLFETSSKQDVIPISLHELEKICREVSIPICAIGGINPNNIDQVLTAKINMAAVISSVWKMDNPLKAINEMHEKISKARSLKNP